MVKDSKSTPSEILKKPQGKKVHLSEGEIKERISKLEENLQDLNNPKDKKKRQRIFSKLVQFRKCLINPEELTIDPRIEKQKAIEKRLKKGAKMHKYKEKIRSKYGVETRSKGKIIDNNKKQGIIWCLVCKGEGHKAKDCTERVQGENICYNCGSVEHTLKGCLKHRDLQGMLPYANCFICKQTGHLSSACHLNQKGVYYKGGECFNCGSVRHLARDCPDKGKR